MKGKYDIILIILLVLTTISFQGDSTIIDITANSGLDSQHDFTRDFFYADPIGDRSLTLPTSPYYAWGNSSSELMDLQSFEVLNNATHIKFQFTLGDLSNPYWSDLGYSLTFISLYIDHQSGGVNESVASEEVTTSGLWDIALLGSGVGNKVYFSNNTNSPTTQSTGYENYGDTSNNIITFITPTELFGSIPESSWTYYVLVGAESYGNYYESSSISDNWQIGGGTDEAYDPDIIDMATPPSGNSNLQNELLQNYNAEKYALIFPVGPSITGEPTQIPDQIIPKVSTTFSGSNTSIDRSYLFDTSVTSRKIEITSILDDEDIFVSGISHMIISLNNSLVSTHTFGGENYYEYSYMVELNLGYQEFNLTLFDIDGNTASQYYDLYLVNDYEEDTLAPTMDFSLYYEGVQLANDTRLVITEGLSLVFLDLRLNLTEFPTNILSELAILNIYENNKVRSRSLSGLSQQLEIELYLYVNRDYNLKFEVSDSFGNLVVSTFFIEIYDHEARETSPIYSDYDPIPTKTIPTSSSEVEDSGLFPTVSDVNFPVIPFSVISIFIIANISRRKNQIS